MTIVTALTTAILDFYWEKLGLDHMKYTEDSRLRTLQELEDKLLKSLRGTHGTDDALIRWVIMEESNYVIRGFAQARNDENKFNY